MTAQADLTEFIIVSHADYAALKEELRWKQSALYGAIQRILVLGMEAIAAKERGDTYRRRALCLAQLVKRFREAELAAPSIGELLLRLELEKIRIERDAAQAQAALMIAPLSWFMWHDKRHDWKCLHEQSLELECDCGLEATIIKAELALSSDVGRDVLAVVEAARDWQEAYELDRNTASLDSNMLSCAADDRLLSAIDALDGKP